MTDERVLLITGASSGIGRATARHAARAGFRVALAARRKERLAELVEELGSDRALAIRCDVQDLEEQKAMVNTALDRFGRLDAVFANAGRGGAPGGFAQCEPATWKDLLMTNVFGAAVTVQVCLPSIKEAKGHILINGSVAGRRTIAGSMYGVTKWAANAIGYNLREELRGTGIRVTLIEPGMVDTPFFDDRKPDALRDEDIARAVLFALQQPPTVDVHELLVLPTPKAD
ncbi:MAG: SDR family oxidoreductase [Myxococcota bacterium]